MSCSNDAAMWLAILLTNAATLCFAVAEWRERRR